MLLHNSELLEKLKKVRGYVVRAYNNPTHEEVKFELGLALDYTIMCVESLEERILRTKQGRR